MACEPIPWENVSKHPPHNCLRRPNKKPKQFENKKQNVKKNKKTPRFRKFQIIWQNTEFTSPKNLWPSESFDFPPVLAVLSGFGHPELWSLGSPLDFYDWLGWEVAQKEKFRKFPQKLVIKKSYTTWTNMIKSDSKKDMMNLSLRGFQWWIEKIRISLCFLIHFDLLNESEGSKEHCGQQIAILPQSFSLDSHLVVTAIEPLPGLQLLCRDGFPWLASPSKSRSVESSQVHRQASEQGVPLQIPIAGDYFCKGASGRTS